MIYMNLKIGEFVDLNKVRHGFVTDDVEAGIQTFDIVFEYSDEEQDTFEFELESDRDEAWEEICELIRLKNKAEAREG